jgi:hypothetical protein
VDYDTNPPPRRGGAALRKAAAEGVEDATGQAYSSSILETTEGNSKGSLVPDIKSVDKKAAIDAVSSSLPLLSMISTDQWFAKRVIVSTGPLFNRSGRVERWGNGWVTVHIDGVGVHNRRSFELFLHPDQTAEDILLPRVDSLFRSIDSKESEVANTENPALELSRRSSSIESARQVSSASSEADEEESRLRASMQSPITAGTVENNQARHLVSPYTPKMNGTTVRYGMAQSGNRGLVDKIRRGPVNNGPLSSSSTGDCKKAVGTVGPGFESNFLPSIVSPRPEVPTLKQFSASAALHQSLQVMVAPRLQDGPSHVEDKDNRPV